MIIHHPDNKSDHSPIYCTISKASIEHDTIESVEQKPRPSWRLANSKDKKTFRTVLEERLSYLELSKQVSECQNVKCRDPEHCRELDLHSVELLETIEEAAEESLPATTPKNNQNSKTKRMPGLERINSLTLALMKERIYLVK